MVLWERPNLREGSHFLFHAPLAPELYGWYVLLAAAADSFLLASSVLCISAILCASAAAMAAALCLASISARNGFAAAAPCPPPCGKSGEPEWRGSSIRPGVSLEAAEDGGGGKPPKAPTEKGRENFS